MPGTVRLGSSLVLGMTTIRPSLVEVHSESGLLDAAGAVAPPASWDCAVNDTELLRAAPEASARVTLEGPTLGVLTAEGDPGLRRLKGLSHKRSMGSSSGDAVTTVEAQ